MINHVFLFFFLLLLSWAYGTVSREAAEQRIDGIDSPLTEGDGNQAIVSAALDIAEASNCDPNVCFAVDGSASILPPDFQLELDFVKIIAGVVSLDTGSQFAAIQYGLVPQFMSILTQNAASFLLAVDGTNQLFAGRTFIAAGLGGCMRQLAKVPNEPKKIILLGDGGSNFDSLLPPLDPASVAQSFLADPKNSICAVGVGFQNVAMLEDITGDPALVFQVADWFSVLDVLADLVAQVCGASAVEF
ncbi:von Willebrand factor A-like protein [Gracilaria domingensis]|nr:von Willebrand factor A-like protein [Gracilaria domingensis]